MIYTTMTDLGVCASGQRLRAVARACMLGCLIAMLPVMAAAAWFDPTWHYRVPINVPAGASVNSTIKVDVDFSALLTAVGAAGTFDVNSPRVTRSDGTSLSATQEFTDTVYAGATDAAGNGRGEVRFILQDAGPTTYYLYFDVTANGPKAANPQPAINGNFEKGVAGTQNPPGWTATKSNTGFDAQVRPSESPNVTTDGANTTGATDGTPLSGAYSYMIGSRTNNEPTTAAPAVTLSRSITVPASNPGNLVVHYRLEGWDSSDDNAIAYDYLRIKVGTTEIVGPNAGAGSTYVTYPFSPNKGVNAISNNASGYGRYNYWDMDAKGKHHAGMTLAAGSQPWFTRTYSLTALAGQTVTLQFTTSHQVLYKSWIHIDDVEWSVVAATLGTPETFPSQPGGFNAYETGTAAGAIAGVIMTKVAGTSFNLDLIALNTAKNAILTTFSGAVKVELLDASNNTGALDANGCRSTWATIQTLATNPAFAVANNGRIGVSFQESNAWRDVRVRISYPATGAASAIGCSNDNFAIRPTSLASVSATDTDWQTAGTGRVLANTAVPGGVVHKAGTPFTIRATAQNALGNATTNYSGSPTAVLTACVLPSGCTLADFGAFSVGTWSAASGVVTTSTASYSEVGALSIQLQDTSFASVDASDTSADCAGRYICQSGSSSVGRFVPDHFALLPGNVVTAACGGATGFTYMGQPNLSVKFGIEAQNAGNAKTANYTGALAQAIVAVAAENNDNGTDLSARLTVPAGGWSLGAYSVNTGVASFSRPATATPDATWGAFDSLQLGVSLTDPDGPVLSGLNMNAATAGACAVCTSRRIGDDTSTIPATPMPTKVRFGRLRLNNAFGSELLDLPIPIEAQYWNGTVFITNTLDSCTTLGASNVVLGNYKSGLTSTNMGAGHISIGAAFANGKGTLKLTKPAPAAAGSVDLAVNLGATSADQSCPVAPLAPTSTGAVMDHLRGKWCGAGYDRDPRARVTFGIYKNANEFIYMREMY